MSALQQILAAGGPPARAYATWNPSAKASTIALSGGNLVATASAGNGSVQTTIGKTTGKVYFEYVIGAFAGSIYVGFGTSAASTSNPPGLDNKAFGWQQVGGTFYNGSPTGVSFVSFAAGSVIGVALDLDAKTYNLSKNNSYQGSYSYSAYVSGAIFGIVGFQTPGFPAGSTAIITGQFGASALSYSPPAGYDAGLYT